MHVTGKTVAFVAIGGGLGALCVLPVNSQNKVAGAVSTSVVECKEKSFPNLPGQNAFALKKEKNGTFTAVTESYGKPKTYPYLKCHFHSKERKVFYCSSEGESLWMVTGERLESSSVDSSGSEAMFSGYLFEVVKPGDDPVTVFSIRFGADKCAAQR
jgi:hypothetical protein